MGTAARNARQRLEYGSARLKKANRLSSWTARSTPQGLNMAPLSLAEFMQGSEFSASAGKMDERVLVWETRQPGCRCVCPCAGVHCEAFLMRPECAAVCGTPSPSAGGPRL